MHVMHICRPGILVTAVGALCCCAATAAIAQSLEQRGYVPIEPMIADVDPLARSLRVQEPGLSLTGQYSPLFRRVSPDGALGDRVFFIQAGVVVEYDRSDYLLLENGDVLLVPPPNTLFHLGLPVTPSVSPYDRPLTSPQSIDTMLDARLDARMDGSLDAHFDGAASRDHTPPVTPVGDVAALARAAAADRAAVSYEQWFVHALIEAIDAEIQATQRVLRAKPAEMQLFGTRP